MLFSLDECARRYAALWRECVADAACQSGTEQRQFRSGFGVDAVWPEVVRCFAEAYPTTALGAEDARFRIRDTSAGRRGIVDDRIRRCLGRACHDGPRSLMELMAGLQLASGGPMWLARLHVLMAVKVGLLEAVTGSDGEGG